MRRCRLPRCSVCDHPEREKIDAEIALGAASQRNAAARYGLATASLCRHVANHLPEALIEAARAKEAERGKSLLNRVDRMVARLEKLAESCDDYGTGEALLKAARELRPYHELLGKVSGEIANDRVQAVFIKLGVSGEDELQRAVDLTRRGQDSSPEEWLEDGLAMVDFALLQLPTKAAYATQRIQQAARKVGMLEPHGQGGSQNGKDARPEVE